jgi:hypothetical protein
MSAPNTSQHPGPLVLLPTDTSTDTRETFPGLIPGLAGGLPGREPCHKSTDEHLNRLEAPVANQAQEIYSLRYSYGTALEESKGLRACVAALQARLAGNLPATRQSPVSIRYNYSAMDSAVGHPKWETPVREQKRSRFAAFFEQMAAASTNGSSTHAADEEVKVTLVPQVKRSRYAALFEKMAAASATRRDSHGQEVEAVPVITRMSSTELTARCNQITVLPPDTPIRQNGMDVDDDPYPWMDKRFGRPKNFGFAASIPTTRVAPQFKEQKVYDWLSAPHVQETEEYADPFPWGRRCLKQPDIDFAALNSTTDRHGKEMQACGKLHAPRPIHPRAPLLNRTDF